MAQNLGRTTHTRSRPSKHGRLARWWISSAHESCVYLFSLRVRLPQNQRRGRLLAEALRHRQSPPKRSTFPCPASAPPRQLHQVGLGCPAEQPNDQRLTQCCGVWSDQVESRIPTTRRRHRLEFAHSPASANRSASHDAHLFDYVQLARGWSTRFLFSAAGYCQQSDRAIEQKSADRT